MAFYRVARLADDVADHATATPRGEAGAPGRDRGLADRQRATASPRRPPLRDVLAERGLDREHMLDLLEAFRRDVTKLRYADWDELMDYCRYSAAPVGRFVLDVHGEDRGDLAGVGRALCAALQVINHLQDCAKDYHELDRVYLPLDALDAAGAAVESSARAPATPALRRRSPSWRGAPQGLLRPRGPSPARSAICAWRWRSARSSAWPRA